MIKLYNNISLNMEVLLDFELIERGSIINNFEARNITIILTIFRKTKRPEKVLIYTCVGISTHLNEHLFRDKKSHIFKHLSFSKNCQDNCDVSCFKIIDNATSFFQLKIKESFHIERLKLEL